MDEPLPPCVRVRRTLHLVALLQTFDEVGIQILDIVRLGPETASLAARREHHHAVLAAVGVHNALGSHVDTVLHSSGAHHVPLVGR